MKTTVRIPYWLEDGTEQCAVCEHTYVLQMEYRCDQCDRGCCAHCSVIVHELHTVVCYQCDQAAGEEG